MKQAMYFQGGARDCYCYLLVHIVYFVILYIIFVIYFVLLLICCIDH